MKTTDPELGDGWYPPRSLLDAVEAELASAEHFGCDHYITSRVLTHYRARIRLCSEKSPAMQRLGEAFDGAGMETNRAVLADPVLRHAINAVVCNHTLGTSEPGAWAESALELAATCWRDTKPQPPLACDSRTSIALDGSRGSLWLWAATEPQGKLSARLVEMAKESLSINLTNACPDDLEVMSGSISLLDAVIPALSRSALAHVGWVCFVHESDAFSSGTTPHVQNTVFISARSKPSYMTLADRLFHEAVHQKFIDLAQTHSLFLPGQDYPLLVENPWNTHLEGYTPWDLDRALTVAHVYLALAVFYAKVGVLRRDGGLDGVWTVDGEPQEAFQMAIARSRFLLAQMSEYRDRFGPAGRAFLRWMRRLAARLAPDVRSRQFRRHVEHGARRHDPVLVALRGPAASPAGPERTGPLG